MKMLWDNKSFRTYTLVNTRIRKVVFDYLTFGEATTIKVIPRSAKGTYDEYHYTNPVAVFLCQVKRKI